MTDPTSSLSLAKSPRDKTFPFPFNCRAVGQVLCGPFAWCVCQGPCSRGRGASLGTGVGGCGPAGPVERP